MEREFSGRREKTMSDTLAGLFTNPEQTNHKRLYSLCDNNKLYNNLIISNSNIYFDELGICLFTFREFRYTHQFGKNIFFVSISQRLRNRMIVRFLCFFLRSMVWLLRRLSTVLPCFYAVCVLHIFPDIADIVSTYSFCEFGVAPSAFCSDPHRDPHAKISGNGWILPGRKFQPFCAC